MSEFLKDIEILNELLVSNNLKMEETDINKINSLISEGRNRNLERMSEISKDIEILNELLVSNNLKLEEKDINIINSLISEGRNRNLDEERLNGIKDLLKNILK